MQWWTLTLIHTSWFVAWQPRCVTSWSDASRFWRLRGFCRRSHIQEDEPSFFDASHWCVYHARRKSEWCVISSVLTFILLVYSTVVGVYIYCWQTCACYMFIQLLPHTMDTLFLSHLHILYSSQLPSITTPLNTILNAWAITMNNIDSPSDGTGVAW